MAVKSKFLASNLKIIRNASHLTQTEAGELFGGSKTMVHSYESGKAEPNSLYVRRVCAVAGVDFNTLMRLELEEKDLKIDYDAVEALFARIRYAAAGEELRKAQSRGFDHTPPHYFETVIEPLERKMQEQLAIYTSATGLINPKMLDDFTYAETIELIQKKKSQVDKNLSIGTQNALVSYGTGFYDPIEVVQLPTIQELNMEIIRKGEELKTIMEIEKTDKSPKQKAVLIAKIDEPHFASFKCSHTTFRKIKHLDKYASNCISTNSRANARFIEWDNYF